MRTRRALANILAQTVSDWQAFMIGDNCPDFQRMIEENLFNDTRIIAFNTPTRHEGCGYWATNYAIQNATGNYFLFFANDDIISPCHMKTYLDQIEGTDFDFVYCDYLAFGKLMKTKLKYSRIGHSALIVRTDFLQQMPLHSPRYGHDFDLITNMVKAGAKYRKADRIIPTYYVMSGNRHRNDPEGLD
jgi:hypothetical protein